MIHILVLIGFYFLPTIIASSRHLHERTGIFLLNLFLGWTFIGWIIALIWAIAARPPYVVYMQPANPPRYYEPPRYY
jgi:Na+/H+-dicarboxylate symporter